MPADLPKYLKHTMFTLNPVAAFSCPATRFMAVSCKPWTFIDAFFDIPYNWYDFRGCVCNYKCPLMRVFAPQCVGDDYTGSYAPDWCLGRIDDICKVLGMPYLTLSSELQRASLAALLVPVYAPFYEYMTTDSAISSEAFCRKRNSRYASSVYWYSLHRFLCHEDDGYAKDVGIAEAVENLANRVKLYINLHKADPDRFSEYWDMGVCIFFDKHNSFAEGRDLPATNPKYDPKWLEMKEQYYMEEEHDY